MAVVAGAQHGAVAAGIRTVRVLTIAHNAVAESNRRRVDALRQVVGVEVSLLTPRWWHEEGGRVEVAFDAPWRVGRTLATGNGTRHVYVSGLIDSIRRRTPDVIDLFEEPFSLVALQTLLARDVLAPQAALVFYSAVNVPRTWRPPYRWIERLVLRRADGAHAPNSDVPPILRARGLRGPSEVIPLGVDVGRFAEAEPMALADVGRPRIGFVGRLEPVKGLDVLIDAFSHLRGSPALLIAGAGSERERLGGPRVRVLPPLSYDQVPGFLKSLDVLVLPSVTIPPVHREQFGRVLVEAMAAGVPVIGSDSGAIPEVIGDAGMVVPERDPMTLAAALDTVLSDAPLRARLSERGRRRAATRFAWPVVAEQTAALFRSAMLHRRRAPASLEEVSA
jgi:glycosyltransferase involved in cell wall biosynthesis